MNLAIGAIMSFGHALYYPHISLTNKNWLKHALLFWDKISRIVPHSVDPCDSEDVVKIRYETGFICDYSPDSVVVMTTFYEFGEFLDKFILSDDSFRYFRKYLPNRLKDGEYHYWRKFRIDPEFRRDIMQDVTRLNGTYIHVLKIDNKLLEKLINIGLAIPGEHGMDGWVKVDSLVGFIYMTYLAKAISRDKSLPIVTDSEQFYRTSHVFDFNLRRDYQGEFEYKLGNLLIETYLPRDINQIPFETIIKIRDKYCSERTVFFDAVVELSQKIQDIDSESCLEGALKHYRRTLSIQADNLRSEFESHGIATVSKFLSISVPSSLLSLSSYVPQEYKPIGIGTGVMFGLISAANATISEKNKLRQQPMSYLLSINSELADGGLVKRVNDTILGIRRW